MNKDVPLLIERLQIENDKQIRNGVYGYTQRNLAYNSNRIEGSTLTKDQTTALFETQSLIPDSSFVRAKDIEEATGHFIMFNRMLKTIKEELSEDLIKKYHYDLKSGVFEDKANGYPIGEYKNRANIVGDIKTVSPNSVPEAMDELIKKYNAKKNITLEDIAEFHLEYERIHPFQDGNGRTGRIIMFKECLKNNIFPFIIEDDNKLKYYEALRLSNSENNYSPLVSYFKEEQKKYYDYVIDLIKEV